MAQLSWQLAQLLEEAGRNFGTHLVFLQEQLGNANVPILEGIHERSDPTAVSAVSFVLAPGMRGEKNRRELLAAPKSSWKGLKLEFRQLMDKPNLVF